MGLCKFLKLICVTQFVILVLGDIYMHEPRGCNNRLDEKSAERKNGNRLFDSQNNDRGGYNVGDKTDKSADRARQQARLSSSQKHRFQYQMRHFQSGPVGKSYKAVEWTHQHGCGRNKDDDPIKLTCQVIMQYMCQPDNGVTDSDEGPEKETVRDGTTTSTNDHRNPPGDRNGRLDESSRSARDRISRAVRVDRGMHEPHQWRDKCEERPRNKGLFTADQNLNKDSASRTRQNPNGNRNGYECPEERDYYPYWHPSDWKDVAILVEDLARCDELKKKSFNTHSYHECVENFKDGPEAHYSRAETKSKCEARNGVWREFHNFLEKLTDNGDTPNSENACKDLAVSKKLSRDDVTYGYALYGTSKECLVNLPEPDCRLANYSRVNHLGNVDGDTLQTNQYNWELPYFPSGDSQRCVFRIRYNISTEDYDPKTDASSNNNDDVIENNPYVPIGVNDQKLRLAINTAQTGRTFQDRSHVMVLNAREAEIGDAQLFNLNVRGKRGNIVQAYPAVEYDFVPNTMEIGTDDLVHVQWTGSNTADNDNPAGDGQAGDDGEGTDGTDRSNILSMADSGKNFFNTLEDENNLAHNCEVVWSKKKVAGGMSPIDLGLQLASAGYYSCHKCDNGDSLRKSDEKMDKLLNNAPASFPGVILKFKSPKTHVIGCTRNNNFSNRSQKGKIIVKRGTATTR